MTLVLVKPLSICPLEFSQYENSDNVIVHRTFYSELMSKILSQPYYLVKIENSQNESEKSVIVGLGGIHGGEAGEVYMPDWIYRGLVGEINEGCYCMLDYNTFGILTMQSIGSCKIKVDISCELGFDVRSSLEIALTNRRTLSKGERFPFHLIELEDETVEGEILELKNKNGEALQFGFVEMNSDVNLDLELLEPQRPPTPIPEEPIVFEPPPLPPPLPPLPPPLPPLPPPPSQLDPTPEERARMVRESWLKHLGSSANTQ